MKITFNSFTSSQIFKKIVFSFLAGTLVACGSIDSENSNSKLFQTPIEFRAWCARESIDCDIPSTSQIDLPLAYWNAAMEIGASLAKESFKFSFSAADLNDKSIDAAIEGLGAKYYLDSLRKLATDQEFDHLTLQSNQISIEAQKDFEYLAKSGLMWQVSHSSLIAIRNGGIQLSGLSFSNPSHTDVAIPIHSFFYTGNGVGTMELGTEKILSVPLNFLLHDWNVIGSAPTTQFPKAAAIVDAVVPFQKWFLNGKRQINLSANFFGDTSSIITRASSYHLIKPLSQMLGAAKRAMIGFPEAPIQLQFDQSKKLECTFRMPGVPAITSPFSQDLRILKITETAPHEVLLNLEGVEGKIDLPGPIKPKMKIQEIAFEAERVVIQKVPIIKEIGIRYADIKLDEIRIDCN